MVSLQRGSRKGPVGTDMLALATCCDVLWLTRGDTGDLAGRHADLSLPAAACESTIISKS